MKKNQMVIVPDDGFGHDTHPLIKKPGDSITQEMKPSGDVVTKFDTSETKLTVRQYTDKKGNPGKKTVTVMQVQKPTRKK